MAAPMKLSCGALFRSNSRLFNTILNSASGANYFRGQTLMSSTKHQWPMSTSLLPHCVHRGLHTSSTCSVKKKAVRKIHHTDTYIDLPEHSNYAGYGFEPLSGHSEVTDSLSTDTEHQTDVLSKVDKELMNQDQRLFAVVLIQGHQHKITENDLLMLDTNHPTQPGDMIELNKVLLVGGNNFTIVGMPLVNRDSVRVEARVIEKSHTPPIYNFYKRRRKGWKRMKILYRDYTVMRITKVELTDHCEL